MNDIFKDPNSPLVRWPKFRYLDAMFDGGSPLTQGLIDFTGFYPPRASAGYPYCESCEKYHPEEDHCPHPVPGMGFFVAPIYLTEAYLTSSGKVMKSLKMSRYIGAHPAWDECYVDLINGGGVITIHYNTIIAEQDIELKGGQSYRWIGNPNVGISNHPMMANPASNSELWKSAIRFEKYY